jgi:putative Mn2+ efflux pump MntP
VNDPTILLLAFGLAMDATAVAGTRGMAVPRIRARHVWRVAVLFGGFQALMPVLGWAIGTRLGPLVEAWDHWIALAVLAAIGGKMLWEAAHADAEVARDGEAAFGLEVMLALAVATSIDAFAVGIALPMMGAPLLPSVALIGVVTAALSVAGLFAGRRFGAALGRRLDVAGGLVLIAVGLNIVAQHTR